MCVCVCVCVSHHCYTIVRSWCWLSAGSPSHTYYSFISVCFKPAVSFHAVKSIKTPSCARGSVCVVVVYVGVGVCLCVCLCGCLCVCVLDTAHCMEVAVVLA